MPAVFIVPYVYEGLFVEMRVHVDACHPMWHVPCAMWHVACAVELLSSVFGSHCAICMCVCVYVFVRGVPCVCVCDRAGAWGKGAATPEVCVCNKLCVERGG